MSFSVGLLKRLNKCFKPIVHPFNLQNDGIKSYARWQYENGERTIEFFLKAFSIEELFKDKTVLDIGCGAAGKTLFYASQGVHKIYGMDIVPKYEVQANAFAEELNLSDHFEFVIGDASKTPFENDFFDTIIMNDAMEHVDDPVGVLEECSRILKPGGRLFVNFPPYYHPTGAHLSDAIFIPWVHLFFSDKTLIQSYEELVSPLPDGEERKEFRISEKENGEKYFSYINKMTIKRFEKIKKNISLEAEYYKEEPLRKVVAVPARLPLIKECFVRMVVCVFKK